MMGKGWPEVPIGAVAGPVQRAVEPVPGVIYRQIGVRLWGQGAYERESMDGGATKYKTLNRVEAGDIIVNKIWARNGSVAVVPDELAGCHGSGEFPTFTVDPKRLLPRWFHWATRTRWFWHRCDLQSRGTSGKNRIRPDKFLAITIPLPPLSDQRRIVAKIDRLAEKIEEARGLHCSITQSCDAALRAMVFSAADGWPRMPMCQIVRLREADVQVRATEIYQFAGVYCFGRGVFRGDRKTGLETSYKRLTRLRAGDFVYPKLMAWEGALATVSPQYEGLVVSPEFPVFEPNHDFILPETLDVYFRSPAIWGRLGEISTGTNVRRRRLQPNAFLRYEMVVPPISTQQRLRAVKTKVDAIKKLQEQTTAELDAMLPSILDKAFTGEL